MFLSYILRLIRLLYAFHNVKSLRTHPRSSFSPYHIIRGLSDGDLIKLGISDAASLAKQRQGGGRGGNGGGEGIFEADKLRALFVVLVCTADKAEPAPSTGAGKVLFDEFEYIEGDPQVWIRPSTRTGGGRREGGG